jgi:FkbM family methyltransferase
MSFLEYELRTFGLANKIVNYMNVPMGLRKLRYHPLVIRLISLLHLSDIARELFNSLTMPAGKTMTFAVSGLKAQFFVETKKQLEYVSQALLCNRHREIGTLQKLLANLYPGDVAFDVGAYMGVFTIIMAKKIGSRGAVVAFEPSHNNFKILERNIRLNYLSNVYPLNLALGESSSTGVIYENDEESSLSQAVSSSRNCHTINIVSGDEVVKSNHLTVPKIIKIDVEGFEFRVIQGFRNILANKACRIVCCEIHPRLHPDGETFKDIESFLTLLKFQLEEIIDRFDTFHALFRKRGF